MGWSSPGGAAHVHCSGYLGLYPPQPSPRAPRPAQRSAVPPYSASSHGSIAAPESTLDHHHHPDVIGRRSSPVGTSSLAVGRRHHAMEDPYVANVSFGRFRSMLQLFHLDVAKVDQGMLHIVHMLQVFQRHVASICSKYFTCFSTYVAIVLIWMFHMLQKNVAIICSKCFSCFSLML